jgi:hypothetical protein
LVQYKSGVGVTEQNADHENGGARVTTGYCQPDAQR